MGTETDPIDKAGEIIRSKPLRGFHLIAEPNRMEETRGYVYLSRQWAMPSICVQIKINIYETN